MIRSGDGSQSQSIMAPAALAACAIRAECDAVEAVCFSYIDLGTHLPYYLLPILLPISP